MRTLSYIRMVLWAFFGVRRRAAATEELGSARPLVLVAIALGLASSFGFTLWGLARLAADTLR